jgi:sulfide dehydrogenase cytochrome subunit
MSSNIRFTVTIAAAGLMAICAAGASADNTLKMCVNCHGEDGRGTDPDVPIIAGIQTVIQEDALYAYADGDRDCGSKPMMCKMSSRLTDEQVTQYAEHFAAIPFVPAGEEFDAALAATGKALHMEQCAICHGENDAGDGESSILHGQRMAYLRYALQEYAAAERKQLPAMEKKAGALTPDDIEALANYYASYR